jgi:hypothetical protein
MADLADACDDRHASTSDLSKHGTVAKLGPPIHVSRHRSPLPSGLLGREMSDPNETATRRPHKPSGLSHAQWKDALVARCITRVQKERAALVQGKRNAAIAEDMKSEVEASTYTSVARAILTSEVCVCVYVSVRHIAAISCVVHHRVPVASTAVNVGTRSRAPSGPLDAGAHVHVLFVVIVYCRPCRKCIR